MILLHFFYNRLDKLAYIPAILQGVAVFGGGAMKSIAVFQWCRVRFTLSTLVLAAIGYITPRLDPRVLMENSKGGTT